ncbi:N-6 DNA methylase [Corynebacterium dentalis]|uniref:N-6 DNA methylase n=1 Tax=Corynebacterium dentalis TaxID=2014528 RepID=UPI000C072B86|nr:N-6 DNA methylase [Corynebacterium dentalis]
MHFDSDLIQRLTQQDSAGRTEADIQSDIKMLLLSAPNLIPSGEQASTVLKLEDQLADGSKRRIDIALGATVIEVKRRLITQAEANEYIVQLQGYVETRMMQTGSRYNGILSDGRNWWLFEQDPKTGEFPRLSTFELTNPAKADELVGWLQAVLAMPAGVTPSPDAIEDILGATSPGYAQDRAFLSSLYHSIEDDPTTRLKRELWARLLRSALGTGFEDQEKLFLDHTMLSIEAAAIGHAVMGIEPAELLKDPRAMLTGDSFRDAGIYNAVEADFFDWVLSVSNGEKFVRQIIRRITMFDWSKTQHDVLKVLYESIISAEARKGAGEYYTPDWLAEGIVEKTLTKPLEQRALDPACGSGTFIYHLVRRIIKAADQAEWDNQTILNHIQEHVFGLDIHPVSVSLARITYLLALGSRLAEDREDVWVPIHLGDSIQWYQSANHDESQITINTDGVDLTTPTTADDALFHIGHVLAFPLSSIEDPGTFDRLVSDMTAKAKTYTDRSQQEKKPSVESILSNYGITSDPDRDTLRETFNLLCSLNAQGRDSIWGYYVRNQVRPLWLSMKNRRMDVLVGNPPWVAYRYMTEDMQQQFKRFSEARNLWHGAKVATHQDLVGLFIVRAVEKYLKVDGRFGFVTPLAVLSRSQYEGLRKGNWGSETLFGEFTEVWDLANVRPKNDLFPVPCAVTFGIKHIGSPTVTPSHGFPKVKRVVDGKRDKSGWEETKKALTFTERDLITLSIDQKEGGSVYRKLVSQGATIVPRFLLFVEEKEASGKLGQSRGNISVTSLRTSLEKKPWRDIPGLSEVVEKRYIYDVHLGSTIVPFKFLKPWKAVLPIDKETVLSESEIAERGGPGLARWWNKASQLWTMHRSTRSPESLTDRIDYHRLLAKQLGGSRLRVFYTASGTALAAAYSDSLKAIAEHSLYWLPVKNRAEARYLTAILNAPLTTEMVQHYQAIGLFGGRHFDTYPWRLAIPEFDPSESLHQELVDLCVECERLASAVPDEGLGFQTVRGAVRAKLDGAGLQEKLDAAVAELLGGGNE